MGTDTGGYTATTLAYVRTSAGVVQVDPEGTIPEDVDEAELQRLVDAGVAVDAKPEPSGEPQTAANSQGGGQPGDKAGSRSPGKGRSS